MRIFAILFLAIGANAAEFTASTFFQTPINASTEEVKPAGGINLQAIVWRGFGMDLDMIQSGAEDTFVDRTAAHLVYRHELTKSFAAVGFAGPAYDFEDRERGYEAGGGVEYRLNKVILFSSVRWQDDRNEDIVIVPTVGVGWRF